MFIRLPGEPAGKAIGKESSVPQLDGPDPTLLKYLKKEIITEEDNNFCNVTLIIGLYFGCVGGWLQFWYAATRCRPRTISAIYYI
jgi:hypothetical protein